MQNHEDLIRRGDALAILTAANGTSQKTVNAIGALPAVTAPQGVPTDDQVASACLSYRHDFGLMDKLARADLMWQAREWLHAWRKEFAALPAPAPVAVCSCDSDVTDMDGHIVHDDDCPESWQSQATIRKSQTVAQPAPTAGQRLIGAAREALDMVKSGEAFEQPAPAPVAGLVEALREAERFMAYFAGETGGSFVGSGTPQTCLASIRAALAAMEASND